MTEQSAYTPPPHFTQQEIDDLAAFIKARVEPLRHKADYRSEEFKVF